MRSHQLALGYFAIALVCTAFSALEAKAQYYYATPRVLPNDVTFLPYVGAAPSLYYFPGNYFPGTYYISYGYSYPAYPVYPVAYPTYPVYFGYAYTYPSYSGYPSPVLVPSYYAPLYSNYFYPYGYGYYYSRGW
jgi:hypothetical protein